MEKESQTVERSLPWNEIEFMILVIPISHVDLTQAKLLAQQIVRYGGVNQIVVVSTWRAGWDVEEIIKILKTCADVKYVVLQEECELGWPESSNHIFYEAAKFLVEGCGNTEPWLFMEADMMPLHYDWLRQLELDYKLAGMPYAGVINKSVFMNTETKETWIAGEHLVGAGIYPADFLNRCHKIHYVDHTPWDVFIGPEIIGEVHHTNLISHRWNTVNYRRNEDGLIVMDRVKVADVGVGIRTDPIPVDAVLNHGCKDSSLYNLLNINEDVVS